MAEVGGGALRLNKLSAAFVQRAKKPGRYGDGGGLYLDVAPGGSRSWLFVFKRRGRQRWMGLGPVRLVGLAEAREQARKCARQLKLEGKDPIEVRRTERQAAQLAEAKRITFRECADGYIAARKKKWRNPKHGRQWSRTLEVYVHPIVGDLPVSAIDKALVLKCLKPIWERVPETASRVRGRIEAVLNWAAAHGHRDESDNPARWKGHLEHVLAARPKASHYAALPFGEIPAFMADLRARSGMGPRALEYLILTAARTGEVIRARWYEIDADSATWTIPAERMKAGREHRVPLSARAIAVLQSLPHEGEAAPPAVMSRQLSLFPAAEGRSDGFVFVGGREGKGLSNMALLQVLERMGRSNLTAHGFRSSFRDWASETTAYPSDVVEMALAHTIRDKTEAAYRRGDLLAKRRRLMADWARYCESAPAAAGARVVALRA